MLGEAGVPPFGTVTDQDVREVVCELSGLGEDDLDELLGLDQVTPDHRRELLLLSYQWLRELSFCVASIPDWLETPLEAVWEQAALWWENERRKRIWYSSQNGWSIADYLRKSNPFIAMNDFVLDRCPIELWEAGERDLLFQLAQNLPVHAPVMFQPSNSSATWYDWGGGGGWNSPGPYGLVEMNPTRKWGSYFGDDPWELDEDPKAVQQQIDRLFPSVPYSTEPEVTDADICERIRLLGDLSVEEAASMMGITEEEWEAWEDGDGAPDGYPSDPAPDFDDPGHRLAHETDRGRLGELHNWLVELSRRDLGCDQDEWLRTPFSDEWFGDLAQDGEIVIAFGTDVTPLEAWSTSPWRCWRAVLSYPQYLPPLGLSEEGWEVTVLTQPSGGFPDWIDKPGLKGKASNYLDDLFPEWDVCSGLELQVRNGAPVLWDPED